MAQSLAGTQLPPYSWHFCVELKPAAISLSHTSTVDRYVKLSNIDVAHVMFSCFIAKLLQRKFVGH